MGLFDRKDKHPSRKENGIGDTSRVKKALQTLKFKYNEANEEEMGKTLYDCITTGTWVNTTTYKDTQGYRIEMRPMGKDLYLVWYTDPSEIKAHQYNLMMTDINKLIDMIYSHPDITGMVINPDTDGFSIDKDQLLAILLHSPYQDQGLPTKPHEWGPGIPSYTQSDLMTEEELTNFAIEIITRPLQDDGYEIISTRDNKAVTANIVARKDEDLCLFTVCGYCAENEPALSNESEKKMREYKTKYQAKCFYAPIALRSGDPQRFEKCLALRGDAFKSRCLGIQKI